jgi:3,5-epimerase/4-reductase
MNKRMIILGNGFIAQRVKDAFNCPIVSGRINSFRDAQKYIRDYKPRVIINCIGHTGRENVDGCEEDIDKTLLANTFVPIWLAEVALREKIKLVHISSGCIYHFGQGKEQPITEAKVPDFFDLFYSRSKIYSERALEVLCSGYGILIVRIRIPLDNRPHPKNILTKLLAYKRIIDVPNSLTYIPDFLRALKYLIRIDARGIYNVVNRGGLRYPRLLDVYQKQVPTFNYTIIPYRKLRLVRTNMVLSTRKLEKTGFAVRGIHEVLTECVRDYLKS